MLSDIITDKKYLFDDRVNTELRGQRNTNRAVYLVNGNLIGNVRNENMGVSSRVYLNGVYGFSSTAEYSDEAVKSVLKSATENACFMSKRVGKNKGKLPAVTCGSDIKGCYISDVEQKLYIDYAKEIDNYICFKYPDLLSRKIVIKSDSMEKLISVSNGYDSHSVNARSFIYVVLTALSEHENKPIELYSVFGGSKTFDVLFTAPSTLYSDIDSLYLRLKKKCEGIYAEAGEKTVVLGGLLSGMLAHEAVGHTVEADLVQGGSVAAHSLNKQVASELVTLVDFANSAFGEPTPIEITSDDEGTAAEDAVIIKDGVLTGYMNSRETAEYFGMSPQGNTRAYLFSDEPLIRMRNTAILPGKSKLEDMIMSVDDGYYLVNTNNGQADTTGEFMFGVTEGYEIKNGKLGRAIFDTTISGVAFEMLKTVDMISNELIWNSAGMCGKKQPMPVGMGGACIRCKVNVGGK